MTTPQRGSDDPFGDSLSPTVIKGAVLIVVALALGIFLLVKGTDTDVQSASPDDPTDVTISDDVVPEPPATTGNTGDPGTDTTPPATARPPEQVSVIVANASGIGGAAGRISEQLNADGYVTVEPANAKQGASVTAVHYVGNDRPEAVTVAESLGLPGDSVSALPDPNPVEGEDLRGASVVVILASDIAPTA